MLSFLIRDMNDGPDPMYMDAVDGGGGGTKPRCVLVELIYLWRWRFLRETCGQLSRGGAERPPERPSRSH